jgi:hypothetical protein
MLRLARSARKARQQFNGSRFGDKVMEHRKLLMSAVAAIALGAVRVAAAQTATSPATQTAPASLRIVVTGVLGQAEVKPTPDGKWRLVKPKEEFSEGCQFRTGPQGVVQFTVGSDQVFRVDRLSLIRVIRANLGADGKIKTDVGLNYGRISKDLDTPIQPHEDTIISPSSTLAVRGTRVSLYDQPPYTPEAVSLTGLAAFQTPKGLVVGFGAKGQGTAVVTGDQPDAAINALTNRIIDPSIANARTAAEQRLLADLTTQGAVVTFDNMLQIPVVYGAPVPTNAQLPGVATGDLVFVVRWNTNTNVDTQLVGPGTGEFLFPVEGFNTSKSGGNLPFDNRGGPHGGFEVVVYPNNTFPTGEYVLGAVNQGPAATVVRFNAFEVGTDGKTTAQEFDQFIGNPEFGSQGTLVRKQLAAGKSTSVSAEVTMAPNQVYNLFGGASPFAVKGK